MPSLTLAGLRPVYDVSLVEAALTREGDTGSASLRKTYERMCRNGGTRYLIKPSKADALDDLEAMCPNFKEVILDLRKYLHLAIEGNESLSFMPILLAGDPGVGKTHFAKMLAKALSLDSEFVSMGSLTSGFVLAGSSPTWHGAKVGKVAQKLIDGDTANPMFLLDELDKAGGDARYDPLGTLLQLLEGETSTSFVDEFLDVPVDASVVVWVATANNLSAMPGPLLSRMAVYDVPSPTVEQAGTISKLIYAGLLAAHDWKFSPELQQTVQEALSSIPPREMKKALLDACGTALMAGRHELKPDDVMGNRRPKKQTIGFVR